MHDGTKANGGGDGALPALPTDIEKYLDQHIFGPTHSSGTRKTGAVNAKQLFLESQGLDERVGRIYLDLERCRWGHLTYGEMPIDIPGIHREEAPSYLWRDAH